MGFRQEDICSDDFLNTVPSRFKDELISSFNSIKGIYPLNSLQMPRPIWKKYQYNHKGNEARGSIKVQLSEKHELNFFKSIHVNRISIGIQRLGEPLRFKLGRKTGSSHLLNLIRQGKEAGFITCGDIIYGLPQQTSDSFINTVQKLIDELDTRINKH